MDPHRLHRRHTIHVRGSDLETLAAELGLDVVGATAAAAYENTERDIHERKARGLFADMKFTMARPEISCHPEALLPGARTVVSAALCYYAPEPARAEGNGRLPRYTWFDAYAELRAKLDELGRRLCAAGGGGSYRVLVDANQHVDREAAARSGVGFYGKNTLLITRRHGSWVVLGTVVTDVAIEPTPPLGVDCGECRLCIDACPTNALEEAGTLDATRCLSYWTQAPAAIPEGYRAELGAQVYGCDICQDVCPWNRGIEKRRARALPPDDAEPHVSLVDWLRADDDDLRRRYDRLYVPRNDGRYLKRNALVAAGNVGGADEREAVASFVGCDDELLDEHARWALEEIDARAS
jgi:epoxyqueuosine reductase